MRFRENSASSRSIACLPASMPADRPAQCAGRESRSARGVFQHEAVGARELRRRSHLEPHRGQRSEIRGEHQLGRVRARSNENVLSSRERQLDDRRCREGPMDARRQAATELQQVARGRKLEGSEICAAGENADGSAGAGGIHQHDARGNDSDDGRAGLYAGDRDAPAVGEQHRERRLSRRADRSVLFPCFRPLVLRACPWRPMEICDAFLAG